MKKILCVIAVISLLVNCGPKQIVVDDCISSSQWSSFLKTSDLTSQEYTSTVSGAPKIVSLKLNNTNIPLADIETKTINNGTFDSYKNAIEVNSEDILTYDLDISDIYRFEANNSGSSTYYYNYNYYFHMVMFPENQYYSNNNDYYYNPNDFSSFKCENLELSNFNFGSSSTYTSTPNAIKNDNIKMSIKQNQYFYNCPNLPNRNNPNVNYDDPYLYNYQSNNIRNVNQNIQDGVYYVGFILSKDDISSYGYNGYNYNNSNYSYGYSRLNKEDAFKTTFIKINFKNKPKENNICVDKIRNSYNFVLR